MGIYPLISDTQRREEIPCRDVFYFKHEPIQDTLGIIFLRVHVETAAVLRFFCGSKILEESSTGGFQNPSEDSLLSSGL